MTEWPALEQNDATSETVHRWSQIIGKIRMAHTPLVNHFWNVTLYVTPRGLTTSSMPYGARLFEMELDFIDHVLRIRVSDGAIREIKLFARSVADMYAEIFATLRSLGIECRIWTTPVEIENPIPFERDEEHHSYDRGSSGCIERCNFRRRCSIAFAASSSASAARCISSGAASISR